MPAHTNNFEVLIDGADVTRHIPFPIKWNDLLDERLDEARISVKQMKTESFAPLTDVYIKMIDEIGNEMEKYYIVSNDFSYESPPGSGKYDHEIVLIEQTKYLEGFLCDTLTFTNDLGRLYTNSAQEVVPNNTVQPPVADPLILPDSQATYVTPLLVGSSFLFKSVYDTFITDRDQYVYVDSSGNQTADITMSIIYNNSPVFFTENFKESYSTILGSGIYVLKYSIKAHFAPETYTTTYTFFAVSNTDPLPKWTIKTVVERLLSVAETRREGDPQRFTLDPAIADKLDAILAPEFAFTSDTLKEALDQIGGFIHAIPRLKGSVITFDFLGGTEMSNVANFPYSYDAFTRDIEDYATKIDSRVDNLVNVLDDVQGTVTDPYADNFKTLRTDQAYARIEDGNVIIDTKYPIQEIKEVRVYGNDRTKPYGVDITPYVFEEADYSRMSSIGGEYPNSKAYAVYFTQGEKGIRGLNFKIPDAVGGGALVEFSLINILNRLGATGINLTSQILVMVTYIPIYSARVEQTKSCIQGLTKPRTLAYNQGANLVETRYYGENLKGVIARIGNTERTRTFLGKKLTSIPKVGQLFDEDYYISSVAVEFCPFDYKCTLGLSKDFNRLSQYIGINSQKRYYEVSEKAAYEREINYSDYLLLTRNADIAPESALFSDSLGYIVTTLTQISYRRPIGSVTVYGETEGGNDLTSVAFPIVKNAFGNSIVFSFSYEDNFSAGNQTVSVGLEGNNTGYYMQGVAYADVYGRIEKLHVQIKEQALLTSAPSTTEGNLFPQGVSNGDVMMDTKERPFIIKKDNREGISFNYQIEFVSDIPSLIIGSAFARNSAYLQTLGSEHVGKLYVLPNRISKFADVLDLSDAMLVKVLEESDVSVINNKITFVDQSAPASGNAWAIVDGATNELLIGENIAVEAGEPIPLPMMTPRHNIYNL